MKAFTHLQPVGQCNITDKLMPPIEHRHVNLKMMSASHHLETSPAHASRVLTNDYVSLKLGQPFIIM